MEQVVATLSRDHENVFLLVEDNPVDVEIVRVLLESAYGDQHSMIWVECYNDAEKVLSQQTVDAIILDMNLPDCAGSANITEFNNKYASLPIVVLTSYDDERTALESIKFGAQDFLTKTDITAPVLARSLHYAKQRKKLEINLKQSNEALSRKNDELESIARTDYLTQLPNRSYFESSIRRCFEQARRAKKEFALLYLDLNNFKKINDRLGHHVGDKLLIEVAQRLRGIVRNTDFIARIGGDEFVIFTDLLQHKDDVYQLIDRILSVFEQPCVIEDNKIECILSIGVSFYPDANTLETLMKHADYSMYEAKQSHHTNVGFYTKEMDTKYARKMQIESQFEQALANDEFTAYFQRISCLDKPQCNVFEALLRWDSCLLGSVSPGEFIPVFEKGTKIDELTYVVVKKSRDLIVAMHDRGMTVDCIKINVTASQLSSRSFGKKFINWLSEFDLVPEQFCLELTERQIVENTQACLTQINSLRQRGIEIALDDFGTGYSSVMHLSTFPIDYLKLDISLISGLERNPKNQALVAGIIEMVHRLDLCVVAEGVETQAEHDCCIALGCDFLQGYFIHRPAPIDSIVSHLSS